MKTLLTAFAALALCACASPSTLDSMRAQYAAADPVDQAALRELAIERLSVYKGPISPELQQFYYSLTHAPERSK